MKELGQISALFGSRLTKILFLWEKNTAFIDKEYCSLVIKILFLGRK